MDIGCKSKEKRRSDTQTAIKHHWKERNFFRRMYITAKTKQFDITAAETETRRNYQNIALTRSIYVGSNNKVLDNILYVS